MQVPKWSIAEKLYMLCMETVAPATVLATVLYWPSHTAKPGDLPPAKAAYLCQGASAAVLLVEMLLSRIPVVSYHWQVGSLCL